MDNADNITESLSPVDSIEDTEGAQSGRSRSAACPVSRADAALVLGAVALGVAVVALTRRPAAPACVGARHVARMLRRSVEAEARRQFRRVAEHGATLAGRVPFLG